MTEYSETTPVHIGPNGKAHSPLGVGGSAFTPMQQDAAKDAVRFGIMATALEHGLTHFDTATGYGDGYSERLIGRFLAADPSRREKIFLASKSKPSEISAGAMLKEIHGSLDRLRTDHIDLYYIHWPQPGADLRPWMEGLETARQQGLIGAVGVSNFSVEQMKQVAEVGHIDAHQLLYNLLWRSKEPDIIAYCVENDIAVVTYSATAHGILAGKYERVLNFASDDQRYRILLFREDVWPHMYEAVQAFKDVAERCGRPMIHLAIRWLLHQSSVTVALVGASNAEQMQMNVEALQGEIADSVFDELTSISDRFQQYIPEADNPFGVAV